MSRVLRNNHERHRTGVGFLGLDSVFGAIGDAASWVGTAVSDAAEWVVGSPAGDAAADAATNTGLLGTVGDLSQSVGQIFGTVNQVYGGLTGESLLGGSSKPKPTVTARPPIQTIIPMAQTNAQTSAQTTTQSAGQGQQPTPPAKKSDSSTMYLALALALLMFWKK